MDAFFGLILKDPVIAWLCTGIGCVVTLLYHKLYVKNSLEEKVTAADVEVFVSNKMDQLLEDIERKVDDKFNPLDKQLDRLSKDMKILIEGVAYMRGASEKK